MGIKYTALLSTGTKQGSMAEGQNQNASYEPVRIRDDDLGSGVTTLRRWNCNRKFQVFGVLVVVLLVVAILFGTPKEHLRQGQVASTQQDFDLSSLGCMFGFGCNDETTSKTTTKNPATTENEEDEKKEDEGKEDEDEKKEDEE